MVVVRREKREMGEREIEQGIVDGTNGFPRCLSVLLCLLSYVKSLFFNLIYSEPNVIFKIDLSKINNFVITELVL